MDLSEAVGQGLLDPAASARRVPFPRLGYDALVHPLSLRTMEADQLAVGQLVGTLFRLAETANFAGEEDGQLTDSQFWAVVLQMLPGCTVTLLRVVDVCATWEKRPDAKADAVAPVTRELPHYVLPLLVKAWVEVNFPDPLALAGWVAVMAAMASHLAPEDASQELVSTLGLLLRRAKDCSSESAESVPITPEAIGSAT